MITLISSPQLIQPVYNPIYITVSSDQTSQEGFKFIFDLYVNGVFVNRDKLPVRPGSTQAVYSPARILESYVSFDLDQNSVGVVNNSNCIDMYEVKCFEEYIVYWNFTNTLVDSYTSSTYTVLTGPTKHNYVLNDYIYVKTTNTGSTFPIDAVYKVVSVIDAYKILINKTFYTSSTNPGKTVYSDRHKTVFPDYTTNVLTNPNMVFANGQWSSYGPDACAVTAGLSTFNYMQLAVPDASCGTAAQFISNTTTLLVPGHTYTVSFTILSITNPSGNNYYVRNYMGGAYGQLYTNPGVGTHTETVTCYTGTDYQIYLDLSLANTGGFGTHAISISDISIIEAVATVPGYDFNGVIQYEEVPVWDYNTYQMNSVIPGTMLSKAPVTQLCSYDDRGSISFFNMNAYTIANVYKIKIDLYDSANVHTQKIYTPPQLNIANTINNAIVHFGVFPWNINQYSTANGDGNIITNLIVRYTITVMSDDGINPIVPVLQPRYFKVSENCSRYEPVRFMFLNSLGEFDYYTATLLGRTTINATRDNMTHTLEPGYVQGDRGRGTINVNAQEAYIVNTDWVSQDTASWLTREFFLSREVYLLDNATGLIMPIIIDITSMEEKKRVNDKLLNYQFNYSKAVAINTIRG